MKKNKNVKFVTPETNNLAKHYVSEKEKFLKYSLCTLIFTTLLYMIKIKYLNLSGLWSFLLIINGFQFFRYYLWSKKQDFIYLNYVKTVENLLAVSEKTKRLFDRIKKD